MYIHFSFYLLTCQSLYFCSSVPKNNLCAARKFHAPNWVFTIYIKFKRILFQYQVLSWHNGLYITGLHWRMKFRLKIVCMWCAHFYKNALLHYRALSADKGAKLIHLQGDLANPSVLGCYTLCILHLVVRRSHSPAKISNVQHDFGKEIWVHTPKQVGQTNLPRLSCACRSR